MVVRCGESGGIGTLLFWFKLILVSIFKIKDICCVLFTRFYFAHTLSLSNTIGRFKCATTTIMFPSILKLCLHNHLPQSVCLCRCLQSRFGFDFLDCIINEIRSASVIRFFANDRTHQKASIRNLETDQSHLMGTKDWNTTTTLLYENYILFGIFKKLFKLYQSKFCIKKTKLTSRRWFPSTSSSW